MIRLHYSDGFMSTSEEIADAVMRYAQALAQRNASDMVTIPIVDETLEPAQSTLLIGPSSQLYTSPASGHTVDVRGEEAVADLNARTRQLLTDPSASPEQFADEPEADIDEWGSYRGS